MKPWTSNSDGAGCFRLSPSKWGLAAGKKPASRNSRQNSTRRRLISKITSGASGNSRSPKGTQFTIPINRSGASKEGKGAIKWTRLSCRSFAANAVRLQLHALAYNLGNFLRTLATPEPIKDWSLTSLKEKLIKIGAKVVRHGRFQMAEVAIPKNLFADILRMIAELRPPPDPAPA
jgi:Transposase DDE domain group 1